MAFLKRVLFVVEIAKLRGNIKGRVMRVYLEYNNIY
jgi:hypothetical protein